MRAGDKIFIHEKVSFNLIRFQKFGKTFELVVDPDLAVAYRSNLNGDFKEVLKAEKVFSYAKKGEFANESDLVEVFGSSDFEKVALHIFKHGEIQLTAEHRDKLRDEKRKSIVEKIHRMAIDPRSGLPHPPNRIENALVEAKVKIDEYAKAEDQVQHIISSINHILPLKVEQKVLDIRIPVHFAAKLHGFIRNQGKLESEQWLSDGSYACKIKIPAGMKMVLIDELNAKTKGSVEVKILD